MKRAFVLIVTFAALTAAVRPAHAQVSITPFTGMTFAGYAEQHKFTMGAALTFLPHSPVSIEVEGGYTPDFFGEQTGFPLVAKSNVTTLMGAVVVGVPINGTREGMVRPYLQGGLGLMRARVSSASALFDDVTRNGMGVTAGAGVIVMAAKSLGIRADARYFRQLNDPSEDNVLDLSLARFAFWRWSVGLVIGR